MKREGRRILCAAVLLAAACGQPAMPRWAPNVERTDITPPEWMIGCFAIEAVTDSLRAVRAREQIDLTSQPVDAVEGRQWYRVELNGSHRKYGRWSPIAASKVRLQVASDGFGSSLIYVLSRSDDGLAGTYQVIGDVSPGTAPEVPVAFRRVPCISMPAR